MDYIEFKLAQNKKVGIEWNFNESPSEDIMDLPYPYRFQLSVLEAQEREEDEGDS